MGPGLAHSDPGSEALHAAQLYCPGPFPLLLSGATVLCFLLKLSHIPHPLCLLLQQENGTTQKRGPIDALPAVPMCSAWVPTTIRMGEPALPFLKPDVGHP